MNLCSKCATESGYDIEKIFNNEYDLGIGDMFNKILAMPRRANGVMPMAIPMIPASAVFPFVVQPTRDITDQRNSHVCGCGSDCDNHKTPNQEMQVDNDMKMRRELNAQLRMAIANEEFEEAAVLRDKIRSLESGGSQQWDSEKNSQDSASAQ